MSKKGALETKSLTAVLTRMLQANSEKIWLDKKCVEEESKVDKPKADGKLGMIEGQLENIVTDVKKNLNAIVTRGEKFDDLQKKSEDLNNHVSTIASMTTNLVFCDAKKSQIGEVIK